MRSMSCPKRGGSGCGLRHSRRSVRVSGRQPSRAARASSSSRWCLANRASGDARKSGLLASRVARDSRGSFMTLHLPLAAFHDALLGPIGCFLLLHERLIFHPQQRGEGLGLRLSAAHQLEQLLLLFGPTAAVAAEEVVHGLLFLGVLEQAERVFLSPQTIPVSF